MKHYNDKREIFEGLVVIGFGIIFGVIITLTVALMKEYIF